MNTNILGKREQLFSLRTKVLQAEQERINGEQTIGVAEARRKLRERAKFDQSG